MSVILLILNFREEQLDILFGEKTGQTLKDKKQLYCSLYVQPIFGKSVMLYSMFRLFRSGPR